MSDFKFPASSLSVRRELDLFTAPKVDVSVDSCFYEKKSSLTNIGEQYGTLIFENTGSTASYVDLGGSYLYVSEKVVGE